MTAVKSRTENSIRNSIWGWISKIVAMVLPFILRTVMIYTIGQEYVGLNGLFTSILSMLSLSELGVGAAIVYSMYKPLAEGKDDEVCALLNLYRKMYGWIGLAVLIIGMILLPFLPHLVSGEVPEGINLYTLYAVYLVEAVISYWFFAYRSSLLRANQRSDVLSKTTILLSVVKYMLQIFVLLIWKNYYLYVIMQPLYNLVFNGINALLVKKMYPQFVCRGQVDNDQMQGIRKRIFGLMIHKVSTTTRNSFDSIIISALFGLTVVARYNNYYFIMFTVTTFFSVMIQAIQASVGNSIATESVKKNYADLCKFQFLYMWIAGMCTALLLCLYQPFMLIWLRDESMLMTLSEVVLWCLYFYLLLQGDMISVYNNAAGLWWFGKSRYILEAVCNLVLNIVLGKLLGTFGVILATVLTIFVFSTVYGTIIVFRHYFGREKVGSYFRQLAIYFVTMVLSVSVIYMLCQLLPMTMNTLSGFGWLACRAVLCIVLFAIIYTIVLQKTPEFREAKGFVIRNLKRALGKN